VVDVAGGELAHKVGQELKKKLYLKKKYKKKWIPRTRQTSHSNTPTKAKRELLRAIYGVQDVAKVLTIKLYSLLKRVRTFGTPCIL
jgi:hypothetical protein